MSEREPDRLRVVGATDLERRLLAAAAGETPSPELRRRMARGLGITAGAALSALPGPAAATVTAGAGAAGPLISAGIVVLIAAGAAVGWSRAHHASSATPPAVHAAPPTLAPLPAPPPVSIEPTPAAVPVAAPRRTHRRAASAVVTAGDLRGEIALLDAARAAAAAGADARALVLLRRYDATFPTGTFRPESSALQIEALAQLGQTDRARAQGEAFLAAHPDSPLAARVARAMRDAPQR